MKNLKRARRHFLPAVLAVLLAAPATAQDLVTPTPALTLGSPCLARVTLSWDVSSVSDATGVLWEVDGDPGFANPTGPEPGRIAYGVSNATVGSALVDLRDHGRVLDGTRYHLRVVAKRDDADVARRSEAVTFNLDRSPEGTYSAVRVPDQNRIGLLWDTLHPEIRACSDRVFWEIKEGSGFTSQTSDPDRFNFGDAAVSANEALIDLGQRAPADFHVRLVGKHDGLDPGSDVGRRGSGVRVTTVPAVAQPRPPSSRPSRPNPSPPPVTVGISRPRELSTLATFGWDELKTVCDYGRQPGSDQLPYENGAYRIPRDQFDASRRCSLSLVWSDPDPTFNVSREAVLEGRGAFVTESGQHLGDPGGFRNGYTLKAEVPLTDLPPAAFRAGLRIERENGEVHVANPQFHTFARGDSTVFEAPRITSFRINGGAASTTNGLLQLDLETTGAQPTQIMISQRRLFTGASWKHYAPTTGAFGGIQTYSLQGQSSGTKTIYVKVRAGEIVSNVMSDRIDYVNLVVHEADPESVLQFAESQGFRHSAEVAANVPFFTPKCRVSQDGFDIDGAVGERCRFRIFQDRLLNEGWQVVEILPLVDSPYQVRVERTPAGRSAEGRFTIEILKQPEATARIESGGRLGPPILSTRGAGIRVRLRGPAEQEWQDAFRR